MFQFFCFLLVLLTHQIFALKLDCKFADDTNFDKSCFITNASLLLLNKSEAIEFTGDFQSKVQTKAIQFLNSQVEYIPEEIYKQFPKVEALVIEDSNLKIKGQGFFNGSENLKKLDLKLNKILYLPDDTFNLLKNLEMIKLYGNQIEYISKNLFRKNTKLMFIDLQHNNVNMVDPRTFETLADLKYFWLKGNICSSKNFEINNDEQLDVMKKMLKHCIENFQASGAIYRGLKRLEQRNVDESLLLEIQEVSKKILNVGNNFTQIHKDIESVKELDNHLNRIDKKLMMYHEDGKKNRKENFEVLKKKLDGMQVSEWKKVFQRFSDIDKNLATLDTQIKDVNKIEKNLNEIRAELKESSKNGSTVEKPSQNVTELELVVLRKIDNSLASLNKAIETLNQTNSNEKCSRIETEANVKGKDEKDYKEDFDMIKKLFVIIGGLVIIVCFSQLLILICICKISNRQKRYRQCEKLAFRNLQAQHDGNTASI